MPEFDVEFLITLVQVKPLLWNKFPDSYKNRNATKNSWWKICIEVNPKFDDITIVRFFVYSSL